jgi:glycosyltransferase involved in cell wall biosynthesis
VRIALDATYSVDRRPSGIAVYSRELLTGLAQAYSADEFLHCYRAKQWKSASRVSGTNVRQRLLIPPLPTFRADLFHALNQRIDKRPAKKVISTFHDLFVISGEYSSPEFRARFTKQARQAAALSDIIIAVSASTANQVCELLGFDRERIRIVPHGVHQPRLETGREREKIILFVGALQLRKNLMRLVEAFESVPDGWRLVLAGSPNGYGAQSILDRIAQSRCRDRIEVTGYVGRDELERLYATASIFAFPSLDEGFGIPVLEAMAYGVPVVTSNRSALAEVAGTAALLVTPEDRDEIADALGRFANSAELRAEFSGLGRDRAARYPWDRAVRETYRVYQETA